MFTAVEHIDLAVAQGEIVTLVGPSGCGKSTLLNMAAGLMPASEGVVEYDGRRVQGVNTQVGYVTQKDLLLPWRTVEYNVGLALEIQKVPKAERRERVTRVLELVGLGGFADRYPSQLSGGMLKRASLAQTLVYEPTTILMDEPFGALDAQLRLALQQELLSICGAYGTTIIFVTHDLEEAILLADRVVVFGKSPGRIVHVEPVNFERPRDLTKLRSLDEFRQVWDELWERLAQQLQETGVA
ncbi:ABC transporter ATP-binding protein [Nocardia fusca]|uniref:ABC transporter ATP-binding protein n=1 Tax=Nocardia fusca TaxID=941183 RepID=UPI001E2A0EB1|nr:ABC transporter ATP-binding protein [Nocardia fusca]